MSPDLRWSRVARRFKLSPPVAEVLKLLYEGVLPKQVARELGCSPHTVDTHIRRIYRKVGENRRDQVLLRVAHVGLPPGHSQAG